MLRRRWLSEAAYADLIALCQFLPGPASSQVGFALGYLRGGLADALLARAAFTLPSAALLLAFGSWADAFGGDRTGHDPRSQSGGGSDRRPGMLLLMAALRDIA